MQKVWIICSLLPPPSPLPLLYLNFKSLKNPNSLYFIRFQCILLYLAVCFSEFWNFNKLKRGDQIYWGGQFCRKSELFPPPPPPRPSSLLLYFNFKIFKEPNSLSFIRFQCTLHDSGVLFSESLNFSNLRGGGGGPNYWREEILQNKSVISSLFLYFYFRSSKDPKSSLLNKLHSILHYSWLLSSDSWNFYKWNRERT